MLLKSIFILYLFGNFNAAISRGVDLEPSSTNVKEITVSIEHNTDNRNEKKSDDPKKNPLSKRTRANLLLNSKVIYPPGSKTASAFNQGILKFQQLLELPFNGTNNNDLMELKNNNLGETSNKNAEINSETKNITIINEESSDDSKEDLHEDKSEERRTSNCGNSSVHGDPEVSLRVLKNNFIEDFGTSQELNVSGEDMNDDNKSNRTETLDEKRANKTQEVEIIDPVNLRTNNSTKTEDKKSSIEILDDDMEDTTNSTDTNSNSDTGNQTTYLPVSAERKSSQEIIEFKPQKLQEIPLDLKHKNSARKEDGEDKDDISQNIKRDILLGNLNPFFSNPSTNSIRNTNSIFFDDMLKKSNGLIGPMNPFVINSISFDGSRSTTSRTPSFARLKVAAPRSSGTVKTLKSISLGGDSTSSSFGSKLGGGSPSFTSSGGSSLSFSGLSSSSLGGSSSSFGGLTSTSGGHTSNLGHSSKPSNVRGRRPGFSRFRNKPSKSKGTAVETVPSVNLGDGKKDNKLNFGGGPSFTQSFSSGKSSVKTIPSLLIREEDEGPKFSSKYQNKAPSAVSSASFTFTPSGSHGRSKSTSRHPQQRTHSRPAVSFRKPPPARKNSAPEEAEGVEILKSVDYSLPEEVGKSLDKTGPTKFKRKAAFEPTKLPEYSMQASVAVDPFMVNLDMYRKPQDNLFNPYLVNTQMKQVKRNSEKSRSFEFRPSLPDSRTRKVKEFNPHLRKNSYFQPSLQFKTITESPQDFEIVEALVPEDEGVEDIQQLENFESDMLFKPYFATQSPKTFHITSNKHNGRPSRSFHNFDVNFATQSPRSFQMPESTSFRHFGNVHMIDLS